MDLHSVIAIGLGAASVASGVVLLRWAKNAPEGYEDSEGFHMGEPPVPVHALQDIPHTSTAPAIDWSKPLELSDGTPVVLCPAEELGNWGGSNPDSEGFYWVQRPNGGKLTARTFHTRVCCTRWGHAGIPGDYNMAVRNRAEPPAAANSNLPALTSVQRAVLIEMSEEIGYTAAVLAANTQAPHKLVVQARRDLAKMGLARLVSLNGDGGEATTLAGRGYILTREGARVRDELLAQTWVAA